MKNIKCPVCGKPDIADYHKEDVVCPQCKSDLSIYRVIDNIPSSGKSNIWKPISAVAILAAAVCGFLLLNSKPDTPPSRPNDTEIIALRDSISALTAQLKEKDHSRLSVSSFNYVIRRGDSYWSISKKFYGTGTKAEEIANLNGQTLESPLIVGDTLKIN